MISIKDAIKKGESKVSIRGWVYRERGNARLKFIVVRDSSEIIQCVIKKDEVGEEKFALADKLQVECSVEVTGVLQKDARAPTGYELHVEDFKVVGWSDKFPMAQDQSVEFQADNRHLHLRSRKMVSILKIRDTVLSAMREHWRKKTFFEYHSPTMLGMQCEGGATLFEVDYFGKPIYLAQTWQLHAEPGIFALEKIFTIQPSFRAEKSQTSRHLTEFWHAEMEVAWEDFNYLQDDAEEMVKSVVSKVLDERKAELEILERDLKPLLATVEKKFPRFTYDEVLKLLDEKFDLKIEWGKDLRTDNKYDGISKKPYQKGELKYNKSADEILEEDYCWGDNKVMEYWCDSDNLTKSELIKCASGCENGACNPEPEEEIGPCIDGDFSSIHPYWHYRAMNGHPTEPNSSSPNNETMVVQSHTYTNITGEQLHFDVCNDRNSDYLYEAYCKDGNSYIATVKCSDYGYDTCFNGTCIY